VAVGKKYFPFLSRKYPRLPLAHLPIFDYRLRLAMPPCIGAGVMRILKQLFQEGVGRKLPEDTHPEGVGRKLPEDTHPAMLHLVYRQLDSLGVKPQKRLAHAPQFAELAKDQFDRFPHTSVGIFYALTRRITHITGRKQTLQFSPLGLGFRSGAHTRLQYPQFHHAHRSLDSHH